MHHDMLSNAQKRLRVASYKVNTSFTSTFSKFMPTIPLDQKCAEIGRSS